MKLLAWIFGRVKKMCGAESFVKKGAERETPALTRNREDEDSLLDECRINSLKEVLFNVTTASGSYIKELDKIIEES